MLQIRDINGILARFSDRTSGHSLYATNVASWRSFEEIEARLYYVAEWLIDRLQAIDDEYVESLIDAGIVDEYLGMGLVEMDKEALDFYASRCKTLFDAYLRIRARAFDMDSRISGLRVRELPEYVTQRREMKVEIKEEL